MGTARSESSPVTGVERSNSMAHGGTVARHGLSTGLNPGRVAA